MTDATNDPKTIDKTLATDPHSLVKVNIAIDQQNITDYKICTATTPALE